MNQFEVKSWHNGARHKTGAGYGIRIPIILRDRYFNKKYSFIILELEDYSEVIHVNIAKKSFWDSTCRELIHKEIGKWMIKHQIDSWDQGSPFNLKMEWKSENKFKLFKYVDYISI
jgi:hypothetical protein